MNVDHICVDDEKVNGDDSYVEDGDEGDDSCLEVEVDRKDDDNYNEDDNNDDYVKDEDEVGCLEAEVDRKELLF